MTMMMATKIFQNSNLLPLASSKQSGFVRLFSSSNPRMSASPAANLKPSEECPINNQSTSESQQPSNQSKKSESKNTLASLRPFEDIPGPKGLPIIGNAWRYLPIIGDYGINSLRENATFNRRKYGKIVREEINNEIRLLHLYDPNDISDLFRQENQFPKRKAALGMLRYRLDRPDKYNDGGIVPENGEHWQRQRSNFNKTLLSKSSVAKYSHKMEEATTRTLEFMDKDYFQGSSSKVTIKQFQTQILNYWALRNTALLFLDCDVDQLDKTFVQELLREIDNLLVALHACDFGSQKWMDNPEGSKHYRAVVKCQDFLHSFSEERIKILMEDKKNNKLSEGSSMAHDWLFIDKLDHKDVVSFVMDAFQAGVHTSTFTLAQLMKHLTNNPKYLELLVDEIDNNTDRDRPLNPDKLENLKWLGYCIKETLRITPPTTGSGRVASDDIQIRDFLIPKGTIVIAHNEAVGRDDEIFENPNEFRPDRWNNYKSLPKDQRPSPFAQLPFGLGARSCIGQRIIMLEMKIFLTRLLQNFELVGTSELKTVTKMLHVVYGSFDVTLEKRK